jgi:hypothetical protein
MFVWEGGPIRRKTRRAAIRRVRVAVIYNLKGVRVIGGVVVRIGNELDIAIAILVVEADDLVHEVDIQLAGTETKSHAMIRISER